jgi:lipopolysaccharide heptosyltransferase II
MRHRFRQRLLRAAALVPFVQQGTRRFRVLFIRPDHIGDLLLATPAVRALKQAQPHAEIHVLAGPWAAPIVETIEEIDQVLTINFPGFDREENNRHPLQPYLYALRVSRQLRAIGYSAAIIMRPDHWWGALLAHAAGIRERIGYALPDVAPFLTRALPHQPDHAVRQNMRLVQHWTGHVEDAAIPYRLEPDARTHEALSDWTQVRGVNFGGPLVCVHPGAGTRYKQWESSRWAQVADALHEQTNATIVFTGSRGEAPLVAQIAALARHTHHSAAGELSLMQVAALYARASLVIGCDSGPMHIAAAVNVPTVTLFGPANPAEFAPWGDKRRHIVLASPITCRPCRVLDWGDDDPALHPCLRDIGIGEMLEAARRLLN